MHDWNEHYKSRTVSATEAVTHIKSGDRVIVAHGCGAPLPLLEAMVANKDAYRNVELAHMLTFGDAPYMAKDLRENFRNNTTFAGAQDRTAINEGWSDFTPSHFSEVPSLFKTTLKPDVVIAQVSPPDESGYVSFGLSVDYTLPAARASKMVIAEVNAQYPRVFGDSFMHVSQIDYFVETDRHVQETGITPFGDIERSIGGYCAELIEDGDTLQLGIGAIPDALLQALESKKDLGIHAEMIADGVQRLAELGVVNGSKKTLHKNKIVGACFFGSEKFHKYLNNNAIVETYPVDYVNDVRVIARNRHMISINSCLQVDLTGQVNSEAIGFRQFSGIGGQQDFIRGAKLSEGGKAILACYSTVKNDTVSRITPMLDFGSPITTSRTDIDFIVTEYGIASLKGETLKNRAKKLINIAHPRFRDMLTEEYEKVYRKKLS